MRTLEIGRHINRNPRGTDESGDTFGQFVGRAAVPPHDNLAMGDVMDDPGRRAIETDKTHAAKHRPPREK